MGKIDKYSANKVDGRFNISPSSLYSWNENPKAWSNSHIDKVGFTNNTNTVFGTVVHAGIEQYFNGDKLSKQDVANYIEALGEPEEVDQWFIIDMFEKTVAEAVKAITSVGIPDKQEYKTSFLPCDGFSIGGTADYRRGSVLGDYKTTSSKKSSMGLYWYQLMTLAYADKMQGIETTHIEICYIKKPVAEKPADKISEKTGKPIGAVKAKSAEVSFVIQEIKEEDWISIELFLKEVVGTIKLYQNDNSLKEFLWRNNNGSFIQ